MSKLKRMAAPKNWRIERKTAKFTVLPRPGPHAKSSSIPLGIVIRDNLAIAEDMREVKIILNSRIVKIDNRVVRDHRFPVGSMDILSIGEKTFMALPIKKGLQITEIKQAKRKIFSIKRKTVLKKGVVQLTLHDGRTMIADSPDYKVGDSVVISLSDMKISEKMPMKEGAEVMVSSMEGTGKIKKIITTRSSQSNRIVVEISGNDLQIPQRNVFVVGNYLKSVGVGE